MKKFVFLIISILVFAGVVASSFYIGDRVAPEITIISTPTLNEDSNYEDLIDYAKAYDENLKSFFIEDLNVTSIIDNNSVTYVAIDESNNVTKLKSHVDIDPGYVTYHIECLRDPIIQVDTKFNVNDYFEVENEYGVKIDDRLKVSKIDTTKIGDVNIEVEATARKCEPLELTFSVTNKHAPVISLTKDTIDYYTNSYWSDNDFLTIIDTIEDDVDSEEYLLDNISIDWMDALNADDDGYVYITGSHTVTYIVTDSDGNITRTTVEVILDAPQVVMTEENVEG